MSRSGSEIEGYDGYPPWDDEDIEGIEALGRDYNDDGLESGIEDYDLGLEDEGPLESPAVDCIPYVHHLQVLPRWAPGTPISRGASRPTGVLICCRPDLDLLARDGETLPSIRCDSEGLKRLGPFAAGDVVIRGRWVGIILQVLEDLSIRCENGTEYILPDMPPGMLKSLFPIQKPNRLLRYYHFPYYKGQRIELRSKHVLQSATYLQGSLDESDMRGIITDIDIGTVMVSWYAYAGFAGDSSADKTPDTSQRSTDLILFAGFNLTNWKHDHWCLFQPAPQLENNGECKKGAEGNLDKRQGAFVVCEVTPFFDIAWEDGTVERLVPDTGDITLLTDPDDLPPFSVPEFRADDFVISRDSDGSQRGEVGIVKSVDSTNCTLCVGWLENLEHPFKFTKEEIVSIYDLVLHPDFYFSYGDIVFYPEPRSTNDSLSGSRIGRITGLKNGIEVNWADGTTSVVGPQAIQHALLYDPDSEIHESSDHESNDVVLGDTTSSSLGTCAGDVESSLEAGKIEEHGEPWDRVVEFDFLEDASKHHFVTEKIAVFRKEWFSNFNKELKILKENPNPFICVRGYHSRMDLFTAVVVGSPGTPYHDGLFFFDLHLSAQYPNVPPQVFFHYGADAINPNLLTNGSICLSLLNTTQAERTESWNPGQSNILQLLLSLQALVLCSKPYFNEYAYSKRIRESDVEKDSLNYNEAVFLKNCSIMLRVIEGPPKGFEEIVVNHFKKRGPFILSACRAYLKGSRVGSLGEDASCTVDSGVDSNSAGFKQSLQPIVLKLQTAFEKL